MFLLAKTRFAVIMLVLATFCWGMGFTWAKNVGQAVNHAAGRADGSLVGPNVMLAARFAFAAVAWFAIFPQACRGWSWPSVGRATAIGGLMFAGLELQHLGLDRTSEATAAFLTNLTVVFVPLIVAVTHRRWPGGPLLAAVVIALVGIWLLTGAATHGILPTTGPATGEATHWAIGPLGGMTPGIGEWLGISCAVAFSAEILVLNKLVPLDSPYRITGGLFVVSAICCTSIAVCSPGFAAIQWKSLATPSILTQWALLATLTTLVAFGLMNAFQPHVEPTRAAVVYLFEPIFAAAFAWISEDAVMTQTALVGAALIILSNIVAEFRWPRKMPDL